MGKKVAVNPSSTAFVLLHLHTPRAANAQEQTAVEGGDSVWQHRSWQLQPGPPAAAHAAAKVRRRVICRLVAYCSMRSMRNRLVASGLPGWRPARLVASPELELWQAAHKGSELLVPFEVGGQRGPLQLRVHLGAAGRRRRAGG